MAKTGLMITFLSKYKWSFFYWVALPGLILYLGPKQSNYYLDNDIDHFKEHYLYPIAIWIWVVSCIIFLIAIILRSKVVKNAWHSSLYGIVLITCFSIFHMIHF